MTELQTLLASWENTGRTAFYYPRKKRVSLNGGASITEREAIERIRDFIKTL